MTEYRFNPPPGWPTPAESWRPDDSWQPKPGWPPAPPGWVFWLPAGQSVDALHTRALDSAYTNPTSLLAQLQSYGQDFQTLIDTPWMLPKQTKEDWKAHVQALTGMALSAVQQAQEKATAAEQKAAVAQASMATMKERLLQGFQDDVERYDKIMQISRFNTFEAEVARRNQEAENRLKAIVASQAQALQKIEDLKAELIPLQVEVDLQEVSLYEYYNPAQNSNELKLKLDTVSARIRRMVLDKKAIRFDATDFIIYEATTSQNAKFVKQFTTLMLAAYNQEAENAIVKAEKTRDILTALKTLETALARVEKLGTELKAYIEPEYHALRKQEIQLSFQFKEQERHENDERRADSQARREEEKAEKELNRKLETLAAEQRAIERDIAERKAALEAERVAKLAHEGAQLSIVIAQIEEDDPKLQFLLKRQAEVEDAKKETSTVLANMRAGYVYVISNIGAFGEGVVKIGLTRRAEPKERVNELGSASVPFRFDTHVLHYSSDAVGLENALHKHFEQRAVNRVNRRKEFFRTTPEEVRAAMLKLSDGAVFRFDASTPSPDYRATLQIERQEAMLSRQEKPHAI